MTSTYLDPTLAEPLGLHLQTGSGMSLRLRPAAVNDGLLLAQFFAALAPEDLRFRFLDSRKQASAAEIVAMVEIDHRRTEHMLAFDAATGKLAASLMMVADETMDAAEVAIAVASEFRGHGIGWTMLEHAMELARERGVKRLRSIEDTANYDALEIEHSLGFRSRPLASVPGFVLVEADVG